MRKEGVPEVTWMREDQDEQDGPLTRAEFGYSTTDWWNGHVFLTGVIGQVALKHRDCAHTYPEELSAEEWKGILDKIGGALCAYSQAAHTNNQTAEQTAEAREALRLFAEWFEKFWD